MQHDTVHLYRHQQQYKRGVISKPGDISPKGKEQEVENGESPVSSTVHDLTLQQEEEDDYYFEDPTTIRM